MTQEPHPHPAELWLHVRGGGGVPHKDGGGGRGWPLSSRDPLCWEVRVRAGRTDSRWLGWEGQVDEHRGG